MAAYAALLSLMNLIHDIQNHHSPPISLDKQQVESLTQNLTFFLGFLESYTSPVVDVDGEADPLEIRIADAAYAAEDVIESYIVDLIKLSRSTHAEETKSTFSGENDDSDEETSISDEETSISGEEVKSRSTRGEETKSTSGEENDAVKKRMIHVKKIMIPVKKRMILVKKMMIPVKKMMVQLKKKMSRSRSTHAEKTKSTFSGENDDSYEETSISGEEVKCRSTRGEETKSTSGEENDE